MTDKEHLLEQYLHAIDDGQATYIEEHLDSGEHERPDVMCDVCLVGAIRQIHFSEHEMDGARERVRERLADAMLGDIVIGRQSDAPRSWLNWWMRGTPNGTHAPLSRRERRVSRPALAVAALLMLATAGWGASLAAASTLPGSPLYGVKRGEEWIELTTAFSDSQRGEVLGSVARRRLAEAEAAAAVGDSVEVQTLTSELDATMRDLIHLTAVMKTKHEDISGVSGVLSQTLRAESDALGAAQRCGEVVLAQSLTSVAHSQQQAIQANALSLPTPGVLPAAPVAPTAVATAVATPTGIGTPSAGVGSSTQRGSGASSGSAGTGASSSGTGGTTATGATGSSGSGSGSHQRGEQTGSCNEYNGGIADTGVGMPGRVCAPS